MSGRTGDRFAPLIVECDPAEYPRLIQSNVTDRHPDVVFGFRFVGSLRRVLIQ